MNLSMKWLNDYVKADMSIKDYCHALTMSGSKVEGYEIEGSNISNVVVGKILEKGQHENADALFVCQVDAGLEAPIQIVTNAKNVKEGDLVPVALDGAVLPEGKIKKGKLRGVESFGMFCGLETLGLTPNDFPYADPDGVLVIEEDCKIGEDIHSALGLDDTSVEFEITSNRPDCLSVTGLARETGATFRLPVNIPAPSFNGVDGDINEMLKVDIHNTEKCQRYCAGIVKNVKIEPSPRWMRERLRASGVRPINNFVDITNYVMLEYGQPMHAFDLRYVEGAHINVRNAVNGEKIVIRILSSGSIALRKITDLGMTDYNYGMFEKMLKCPHGVILVTGPTGSGKTTTLYAALGEIAKPNVNVITVEDPVEKNIDGINQVQVNTKAGMTFAAALRSILRQDPDIVMIGEMRDTETAEIGVRAAITGHLVLSTLHTNDAASTITRLVDMGVPSYMVASSLIGVVAQRLVKVLCPKCRKSRMSTAEENHLMGLDHSIEIYEACGCSECNNSGYKGRTAIHEIIHCTPEISELIVNDANKEQLERAAKAHGTKLLRDNVSVLVQQGKTTIDELVRVTYTI